MTAQNENFSMTEKNQTTVVHSTITRTPGS